VPSMSDDIMTATSTDSMDANGTHIIHSSN
jgi:hypothetical protein